VTETIEPFTDVVQYMDNASAELCDNTFVNDCSADATCSSEGRNVVCSCNEGFEDQVKNSLKPISDFFFRIPRSQEEAA
jgi:hypothetical protein